MRIFDCFLYNGEKELLKLRMKEMAMLANEVIHFASVSEYTFTGQKQEIVGIPGDLKAEHIVEAWLCDTPPNNGNPWDNETHQRNFLKKLLEAEGIKDNDIVIISDADEIPSAHAVSKYRPEYGMCALQQDLYYYYLNTLWGRQVWRSSRIMTWGYLKDKQPDEVRRSGFDICLVNGGWHYSYMGGVNAMLNKFTSFSHQEEGIQKLANEETIKSKMESLESLWDDTKLKHLPIDDTMPWHLRTNQEKFKHMLYVP